MNKNKKQFSEINLFIRSLLFSIYSLTTITLYSFLCVFSIVLPLSYRHKIIRSFLRAYMFVLKNLCHIDYKIEGLENIPSDRRGVVLSKHQSTWETMFLPLVFKDPAVIVKQELLWLPFFGWGLAVSDPIAIDRKNKSTAMQQIIEKGKKRLADGRWILVFPEGTRVPYGQAGHYRLGGPRLAVMTNSFVIPVAHNAGKFWPRRKFIKRPGTVRVVIGPVIEASGRSPEEVLKLTKDWIEGTVQGL